jgi:hypothetical protein
MPTPEHALQALRRGQVLGKRDWASGFHHLVLSGDSRRMVAFRHPVTREVGRFTCLPFGPSQGPGRYWDVAHEFLRIAAAELRRVADTDEE